MPPSENSRPPIWMECSIYRKDRIKAITVREYLTEVSTENIYWQERPNRMLRYRTISQCAKLALGVNIPEMQYAINSSITDDEDLLTEKNTLDYKYLKVSHKDRMLGLKEILKNGK
jgi:hypothetical protein